VKLLNAVNDKQWTAIVKTAEALIKAPKPVLFKELEPVIPYSSDVEIINCDGDDEDEDDEEALDNETMDDNEPVDSNDEAVDGDDEAVDKDAMEVDDVKTDFGGEVLEDDDFEA
jgi:hypothetical protein